jgi:anti-sigma regulatory factor (Ser/Thr protein kinase)
VITAGLGAFSGDGSGGGHGRPGSGEPSRAWQTRLPAAGQAAALARLATREVLAHWQLGHLTDTAILLVSELVTNALQHAWAGGPELALRLETTGPWLRIEVHDADPRLPEARTPAGLDESGYGLMLVEALADKWGVRATAMGKAIWVDVMR